MQFDDCASNETRIKYLTDGMLLREMLQDPLLMSYSVIMVDEAHECSLATEMVLGLLRKYVSATLINRVSGTHIHQDTAEEAEAACNCVVRNDGY